MEDTTYRTYGRPKTRFFPADRQTALPAPNQFVRRIDGLITASSKTQRQIAMEMGYPTSNIISMFKQGVTRVPMDKVPALAASLNFDAVELLRLWLEAYQPEIKAVIESSFGELLSVREKKVLAHLRRRFPNGIPDLALRAAEGSASP